MRPCLQRLSPATDRHSHLAPLSVARVDDGERVPIPGVIRFPARQSFAGRVGRDGTGARSAEPRRLAYCAARKAGSADCRSIDAVPSQPAMTTSTAPAIAPTSHKPG